LRRIRGIKQANAILIDVNPVPLFLETAGALWILDIGNGKSERFADRTELKKPAEFS
jgi:hypothetical protein